jgi:hypothetical protein
VLLAGGGYATVYLLAGGETGTVGPGDARLTFPIPDDRWFPGGAVGGRDADGDGMPDVVIGAPPRYDTTPGTAWLCTGLADL